MIDVRDDGDITQGHYLAFGNRGGQSHRIGRALSCYFAAAQQACDFAGP